MAEESGKDPNSHSPPPPLHLLIAIYTSAALIKRISENLDRCR